MPMLHTQYHYCTPDWSLPLSIHLMHNLPTSTTRRQPLITGLEYGPEHWNGTLEWNNYGMDYGILTKASTGGSRSVAITILSAVQCKSELLQFTVHANNCFSDSSRILVCMWLHDRRWASLLWRITIHGMGGGGREGRREGLHTPFCE